MLQPMFPSFESCFNDFPMCFPMFFPCVSHVFSMLFPYVSHIFPPVVSMFPPFFPHFCSHVAMFFPCFFPMFFPIVFPIKTFVQKLGTQGDRYIIQDLLSHLHGTGQLTWTMRFCALRFPENRWGNDGEKYMPFFLKKNMYRFSKMYKIWDLMFDIWNLIWDLIWNFHGIYIYILILFNAWILWDWCKHI